MATKIWNVTTDGAAVADSYAWVATSDGNWADASNWDDVTAGTNPATAAPDSDDLVTITGAAINGAAVPGTLTVTGPGASASLTILGSATLSGAFSTGALSVGSASTPGELDLAAGTVVNATSATLLNGPLTASGAGTKLLVSGALVLGGAIDEFGSTYDNDGLTVEDGAAVQAGSLSLIDTQFIDISVDGTSKLEVGTAGSAAEGTLTVDAGQTVSVTGTVSATNGIVNAGIITSTGYLSITNPVTGSGQIQIGANSVLTLSNGVTTEAVDFAGPGGQLNISPNYNVTNLSSQLSLQGIVSGFGSSDIIQCSQPVTGVSYATTGVNLGVLTLTDAGYVVGTLTLAGNFSGDTFEATPILDGFASDIVLETLTDGAGTPGPGTIAPDVYQWNTPGDGRWDLTANWDDVSAGDDPATVAPGSADQVTLIGPTGRFQFVTGPGASASLTLVGGTALNGDFTTGALTVGTASTVGGLDLLAASALSASSADVTNGVVEANGAKFTVTGALTLGGTKTGFSVYYGSSLSALAGANVQLGSLTLTPEVFGDASVLVDGQSSIEVGSADADAAGTLTIAAGSVVSGAGELQSANGIVNAGTILAEGGELYLFSPVSGDGQLQIGAGGTLELDSYISTQPIAFTGAAGTLALEFDYGNPFIGKPGGLTAQGDITGFTTGDSITYNQTLTAASYQSTGTNIGTLTLFDGTSGVGSLTLLGNYTGDTFDVNPSASGDGAAVTLAPATDTPFDFSGNGRSDLLLQNTNGTIVIEMQSGLALTGAALVGDPGATWHVMGSADFNGDGQPDILLQNTSGAIVDYLMNGAAIASSAFLGNPGPSWHVRGAADFNGDGKADVLLQNDDGAMVVWDTNGASTTGTTYIGNPGAGWTVEGVADFNGDGQPDILVQNTDGALVVYTMQGSTVASGAYLGNPGAGWSVAGAGEYGANGDASILLHNDDGTDVIWDTNGSSVTSATLVGNPGANYTGAVAGVNLTGSGSSGLVIQGTDSMLVGYTLNNTATITAGAVLGTPGAGWNAIGNNPLNYIDGTGASTALAGTPGADQFDLTSATAGLHTISNFDPVQDSVALSVAQFANYGAVQAAETPYQGGTSIQLATGSSLVIQGVTPDQLSAADFVFR